MALVSITGLSKSYSGVRALDDVSLNIERGEVHALCGENGAGKSTLIKCLTGIVTPDGGQIRVDGKPLSFGDVVQTEALGVAVIHQESTAFPDLHAVDNLFVGREKKTVWGLLDYRSMRLETKRLLDSLGQDFDLSLPVAELSLANRQMVGIARALSQQCKLMIMDEPTASLSGPETDVLKQTVRRLREQGQSILYVSHRLSEVFELADTITVLRDGKRIASQPRSEIDEPELIRLMVGRETRLVDAHDRSPNSSKEQTAANESLTYRLEVRNLTNAHARNVSLAVADGEIVGLAGLVGAGRSELARAIMGIDRYDQGEVLVDGATLQVGNMQSALRAGVSLVPEDRQHEGLVLQMTVAENLSLAVLRRFTSIGLIDRKREFELAHKSIDRLGIKAAGTDAPVESLSGGNQQKVVLGKCLATDPRVLILDEPTRGVDVGAKSQVHTLIRELAEQGMATLMISSELTELLSVCDRIYVMRLGEIAGELRARDATQETLLQLALPEQAESAC